ncbi:STAS domain-containing protein [Nocardia sp. NPDC058114]|uniref:STAS domain-containing protein n=1 Tax=Nocardia sp. NPDC058114 TaxID=3346346 RepID=UPI0036DA8B2D
MQPPHYRGDLFPPVAGEPADLCERLHANLVLRADAAILHVYGEADAYTQPRWRRILDIAITEAADSGHLVINLSSTRFIGCRPILDLADRAQQGLTRGVQVSVFNPFPNVVDRVVTVAGLTEWLPVHTTLDQALSAAPARVVVSVLGSR